MIRLKAQLLNDLMAGGLDDVWTALQQAIELEHATIPPYLYALYSLDPARNGDIAEIIQSVVVEEMLHMTLACNILNALGGSPVLDHRDFVPTYPGALPGAIETPQQVRLECFSKQLVREVFMEIEEPEAPLAFEVALLAAEAPLTIGLFYQSIKEQIISLGDGVFSSEPRNQVPPSPATRRYPFSRDPFDDVVIVTNVATAVQAIDTIVEQGEGTSTSPSEVVGHDFAHYYRFAEVFHGRRLIEVDPNAPPEERFSFSGPVVPFDEGGVYQVGRNPKAKDYQDRQRRVCETFNYTYTNLLKVLHATFNGQPEQLETAIGLMMSLEVQARDMMSGRSTGGVSIGPSFEYTPTNPPPEV